MLYHSVVAKNDFLSMCVHLSFKVLKLNAYGMQIMLNSVYVTAVVNAVQICIKHVFPVKSSVIFLVL